MPDPFSFAGLVLSITWVAAPAGLVLGLVGLRRTRQDVRGGRWAAITATVIGLVGVLAIAPTVMIWSRFSTEVVALSRLSVGQCIDVFGDVDQVSVSTVDCTTPHTSEVVHRGRFDAESIDTYRYTHAPAFCAPHLDDRYTRAARTGDYAMWVLVSARDRAGPRLGDVFVCLMDDAREVRLDGPITGSGRSA